jgi:ABC-type sugar transport system ATPase subunit
MNFVPGAAVAGAEVALDCGPDGRIAIAAVPRANGFVGAALLGVRPQDLELLSERRAGAVPATATLIQLVGSEKLVDVAFGAAGRLTAQVKADAAVEAGHRVWVGFDPARLHLFEPVSGRNLALG